MVRTSNTTLGEAFSQVAMQPASVKNHLLVGYPIQLWLLSSCMSSAWSSCSVFWKAPDAE